MKNSGLFVSATKWKNGRKARRPKTTSAASPSAAGASVLEKLRTQSALAAGRECADHHEQRRDRQILKEQHRETRPAGGGMEPLAFDQHGHDDRGRGHRERRADGQRRGRSEAEAPGEGAQDHRRDDDLRKAEPEHQPAHAPQSLERQLEPHREQQRDHAEGGDAVDRFDVDREGAQPRRSPAERPETVGPERDPRQQIAKHRTDAQPEEQRRDYARRHQEQQRLFVEGKVDGLVHVGSVIDGASLRQATLVDLRVEREPRRGAAAAC